MCNSGLLFVSWETDNPILHAIYGIVLSAVLLSSFGPSIP
jgi:hypothetical protein